jgi:hypothetical protein
MVRKIAQDGGEYHEPPYTDEEWADIIDRTKDGPIAWIIGPPAPRHDETSKADQKGAEEKAPPDQQPE